MPPETAIPHGRGYFSMTSTLLLVLSLVAFSDNLLTNVGQPSNRDPKFIIHGLFGLAWYVLLATQAHLMRVGEPHLHRRVGIATFVVALGVSLSTLYLFVILWNGWGALAPEARANRLLLPGFCACLLMAWRHRRRPAWHPRWVLTGTFFMLGPVLARTYDPLIASWVRPLLGRLYTETVDEFAFQCYLAGTWVGTFLSLVIHDIRTRQHPHLVTALGFGWLAIALLASVLT